MKRRHGILASWLHGRRMEMPALGHRELEVLDHLWLDGSLSAPDLHARVAASGEVSLNTIQSTLERLRGKGLVERRKSGRSYVYAATLTRTDVVRRVLNDLARDVGGGDLAPLISGFAGLVAGDDPDVEARLLRFLDAVERGRE